MKNKSLDRRQSELNIRTCKYCIFMCREFKSGWHPEIGRPPYVDRISQSRPPASNFHGLRLIK